MSLKEQIEQLQEARRQEIFNSSLPIYEKIEAIEDEKLYPASDWLIKIFAEEQQRYVIDNPAPFHLFDEPWLKKYDDNRGAVIPFTEILNRYGDMDMESEDRLFTVFTLRASGCDDIDAMKMSYEDIEKKLYNIMIAQKICGVMFDW